MLKKTLERIIKCPNSCPCSDAIKKVFKELKINVVPLVVQKDEIKNPLPIDRKDRCD